MIEEIIYSTVKSDRALQEILGGSSKDSRIYPNVAQVKSIPCVIYYASAPTNPITERWAYQQTISFEIYAKTLSQSLAIQNRLYEIFNKYDDYFNSAALFSGIIITECHAVNAQVSNNFPLENEQAINSVVAFDFKFTKENVWP